MIPEFGHFALIIGFVLAIILTLVPAWGALQNNVKAMALAPGLAIGVLVFVSISFICLCIAFLQDDFSVKVVTNNSNSLLPPIYKFSAVWGNHEGSLLLWSLILSTWTAAVAIFSRQLPLLM
ncbi:MAG: heme lyase NrfEFG subunit NrfE, partial [Pseudomonadota bacterium]